MSRFMARQGDILIVAIDGNVPASAKPVTREGDSVVLAHGEATNHRHRIRSTYASLFEHGDTRLLRIDRPVDLVHEEHAPIRLDTGLYKIVRQREYVPLSPARTVID